MKKYIMILMILPLIVGSCVFAYLITYPPKGVPKYKEYIIAGTDTIIINHPVGMYLKGEFEGTNDTLNHVFITRFRKY